VSDTKEDPGKRLLSVLKNLEAPTNMLLLSQDAEGIV
jgi:hypothetical protein